MAQQGSTVTDDISKDGALNKKDNLFDKLNKRHKERKNYWESEQEQRQLDTAQQEDLDYFEQSFAERTREIEERLRQVSTPKKLAIGDIVPADLSKQFADIMQQIQELQGYLSASTLFLADARIKSYQRVLNELTVNCDELRKKVLPKKKFGFSNKKVVPLAITLQQNDKTDAPEKQEEAFVWTISNRKNDYICLSGADVNNKDITIANLQHCLVELQGHAGSVQIKNVTDCTFLCGPVARSLFVEQCNGSSIAVACQQLRLHTSTNVRIYLHVTCRAIIEDCKQIEIAAYNYDYVDIENDFKGAALDKSQNNYTDIADFNWLSPDAPSPNWCLLKDFAEPNWNEVRRNFGNKTHDNSIL